MRHAVLRAATLKETPTTIQWNEEMKHAFRHVKYMLCSAPALGLPDYKLTFHLYVAEVGNEAAAVLAQMHRERPRPIAYYSKTLPLIVKGMVSCLRAVAAAAIMIEKAQTVVLGHPMILHASHAVVHLKALLQGKKEEDVDIDHDCMDLINSTSSIRADLQ
uniref:Reverse transcriptase/retrotransposon-derived protein RNase H-like domain-containing protein n=1 Tax=Seriola lalandi dorsalis TaxID=1841481 RepID=A0A3B4X445_SERLL